MFPENCKLFTEEPARFNGFTVSEMRDDVKTLRGVASNLTKPQLRILKLAESLLLALDGREDK